MTGRIAVVGDASVDYVVELPPGPAADEKLIPLRTRRMLGGTGANAAAAIRSLGSTVTLHAAVGDDPDGVWVLGRLRAAGLDTGAVAVRPGPTAFATILLRGKEREVIVDIGVGLELAPVRVAESADVDLVYVSYSPAAVVALVDAGLGPLTVAGFEAWMVDDEKFRHSLESCRLLVTNRAGWEALLSRGAPPGAPTVQTRGAEGVRLHRPDLPGQHFPPHAVGVVDATGAGDCFAGTLCHYLADGFPIEDAIPRAVIAGALATTVVGGQGWLPTPAEIESLLPLDGSPPATVRSS